MSSTTPGPFNFAGTNLRLRNDASIEPLPIGTDFWQRIMSGSLGSFHHEYLVTMFSFSADWQVSEMHPNGDELVCLLDGRLTMVLEHADGEELLELRDAGSYVLVPRGTWHTARTQTTCRMLFITAGEGTQHRPAPAAKN
jgi:mannose-6-phosphate isomerase-like protein (cupin superfamily)